MVTYGGASSGTVAIGEGGNVDVTISGVTVVTTLNLTDVSRGVCNSPLTGITANVTVNALPTANITSNTPVCSGDDAIFTITGTAGDVVTYSGASSGTVVIGAGGTVDITINGATVDTILTLTDVSSGVCNSPLIGITATVTVDTSPIAPTLSSNSPVCSGDDAIFTITGTPGDVVTYSGTSSGTATIGAVGTVDVTISGVTVDTTLTLTDISSGVCNSTLIGITATVTVNALPAAPTLSGDSPACSGSDVIFTITGTTGDVVTYSGASGGTVTIGAGGTVDVVISSVSSDTTLNVTNVSDGICNRTLTGITATITVNPFAGTTPIISPDLTICLGEDAVFTITGTPGDMVDYTGPSPGTATIGAGGTVDVIVSGLTSDTIISFGQNYACGFWDVVRRITVNTLPSSAFPVVSDDITICPGEDAVFTITGTPGDSIIYFGATSGAVTIGAGGSVDVTVSGVILDATINFISAYDCGTWAAMRFMTISALPTAPTLSSISPVCSGGDAIFTITGTAGDVVTYSGATSGTVTIGAGGTVDVTIGGVTVDTILTLTDVSNGVCSIPLTGITATVTVNALPTAPMLSSNSPVCSRDDAIFTITGSAGDVVTYSGASSGTVAIGAGGTVDVTISVATVDTALTLIDASNGVCTNVLSGITETVAVDTFPIAPTLSSNSPVCSGDDAIFTITGTAGDVVTYSGASSGTATIGAGGTVDVTTSAITVDTTLILTDVSSGACTSVLAGITETVMVNALPTTPTLSSNSPVCSGDDAIFTITGAASDVITYSGASSGTVTIGTDGTVDVIISGATVDTTLNLTDVLSGGCNSPLTGITATVTVNSLPTSNITSNTPICSGDDAIFTITGTAGDVVTYSGASSGTATIAAGGTVAITISGVTVDTTLTLTDVSNGFCTSALTGITETVTVNALATTPTLSSNSPVCSGDDAIFTITGTAGDVVTYSGASSGTAVIAAGGTVAITISGVTVDTTLTLTDVSNGFCTSVLTGITETVTVNVLPTANITSNTPVCSGDDAIFTITGTAGDVVTYDGASSGSVMIGAGGTVDVTINGVTVDTILTLFDVSRGACNSTLTGITATVTVDTFPTAPTLSGNSPVCSGDDAIFTITGTAGYVVTYSGASSGTATIGAGGAVDVTISGVTIDTTLNLTDVSSGGCNSPLTGITETVRINALPTANITSNTPVCLGDDAIFTITGTAGDVVTYSGASSGTAVIAAGGTVDVTISGVTVDTTLNLTDVSRGVCNSPLTGITATVTVNALPTANITSNTPICSGDDAIFTITGIAGDVVTYSGASSGTVVIGAGGTVDITINGATVDTILTLTDVSRGTCNSTLTGITATVTVDTLPTAPTLSSNSQVCSGDDAIFTITGTAGDVVTYSGASSGTATIGAVGTVDVTISGVTVDTTLTLTDISSGACNSTLTGVTATVTVNALPAAPTLSGDSPACSGSDVIFTIIGTAGDVVTYSGASGGTVTIGAGGTVDVVISSVSSDTTLNVTNVSDGICNSTLTGITATITINPSAGTTPTITPDLTICLGEDAVFTITGSPGDMVDYTGPSPGTATIGASGTVDVIVSGLTSDAVISFGQNYACGFWDVVRRITVNTLPSSAFPVVSDDLTICPGEDAVFTITGTPGDSIIYFGATSGAVTIGAGGSVDVTVSGVISDATINFISAYDCGTWAAMRFITISALPTAPTLSSISPVCSGGDAIFTITGTAGDVVTYSGATSGTVTIGAGGTVDVTIGGVTVDTILTLTDVSNGVCSIPLTGITATVTVNALPTAPMLSSNSPVCSGDDAIFTITGSAGDVVTYSGASSGTVAIGAGGTVDVTISVATVDTTLTLIDASNGVCTNVLSGITETVAVDTFPIAPTLSSNSPVCSGDDAIFTITGTAGDVVTYSGASGGTATIGADGTVDVTTSAITVDTTLTLTDVSSGACTSVLAGITETVMVNALPTTPTLSSNSPVCSGDDAIFTITGAASDVITYSGASSGTVTIGTAGTVDVTISGATVDTTLNLTDVSSGGCNSPLTGITATVTVNSLPTSNITSNTPICSGDDAIFTITGTVGDVVTYSGASSGTAVIGAGGTVDITISGVAVDTTLNLTDVSNSICSSILNGITETVTVNALPTAPTLSSNSPVCSGEDAIFTITGTAGDVVTYSGASSGTAVIAAGGTVAITISGVTADITLNLTDISNGFCTNVLNGITEVVAVNALPTAPTLSSNSPVCSGGDAIFTITGTAGDVVIYSGASSGMVTIGTGGTADVTISGATVDTILTLTDVSRGACNSTLTGITATVTVTASPTVPTLSSNSQVCSGGDAIFTITGTAGDVVTYSGASSGTATIGAGGTVDVTISGVAVDTILTLTDVSNGVCSIPLPGITATVTVNALPTAPTLSSNSPVCSGEDAIFTITGTAGDVVTYSGASNGTATIGTGGTADVTISGATVDTILTLTDVSRGACNSTLTGITATVTVTASPTAPTLSSTSPVCSGDDAIFTIIGTAGDVVTYSGASSGTAAIGTAGTADVTISGATVDTILTLTDVSRGACNSTLTGITATVTVTASPTVPTLSSNSPVCSGEDAIFTMTGTAGDVVTYSGASSGTVVIGADGTVDVTISGVTVDTILTLNDVSSGGCNISLTGITATVAVNVLPTAPTLSSNGPVCSGEDAIFTMTGTAGDVVTYSGASSGTATIAAGGTVAITISGVTVDTTLTLTDVSRGACNSILTGITATVTVDTFPTAPTLSSTSPVCSGDDAIFTITGTAGYVVTYSGASSGTAVIGAGGTVDVTISGVAVDTTLTLTDVSNGFCTSVLTGITEVVVVNALPTAPTLSSNSPVCSGEDAIFTMTGTAGYVVTYSGASSGTVVIGADGTIDVTISGVTVDTALNLIDVSSGGCNSPLTGVTANVTVNALPAANITSNTAVCSGDDAIFTITGTAADVVTYSGASSGTAVIGVGGSVDVTISGVTVDTILTLNDVSRGACNSTLTGITATVTVDTLPTAPTLSSASPVCSGDDAIFTITGTAGYVVAYSGASNGTAVIGAGGTVDVTISGVTVVTTLNLTDVSSGGCNSPLTGITATVTVNALPAAPTLSGDSPACSGSDVIFTITGTAGDVVTYSGASGGTVTIGAGGTVDVVISSVSSDTTLNVTNVSDGICNSTLTGITATITVNPSVGTAPTISPDLTICLGEDAVFTITGSPGDMVDYTGPSPGTATIGAGGTVDVIVSGLTSDAVISFGQNYACGFWDVVRRITVNTLPSSAFPVVSDDITICPGEDAVFTITGTLGDTIVYFGATSGAVTIGAGGSADVTVSGVISDATINFISAYDCGTWAAMRFITISALPTASTLSSISPVCSGGDAIFTITGTAGDLVTYSGASSGTATIGVGGAVDVTIGGVTVDTTLTLTDVSNGVCSIPLTGITATVTVNALPTAPMLSSNSPVCSGEDAIFTITGTAGDVVRYRGASSGTATIGAGGTVDVTISRVRFDTTLKLNNVANTTCNNASITTATVKVKRCKSFEVFNMISPNDGNDLNDFFCLSGIENFPNNSVRILNRRGFVVFETYGYGGSTGKENVFRGYSNGRSTRLLPRGTYFYIIERVHPSTGEQFTDKGFLFIN